MWGGLPLWVTGGTHVGDAHGLPPTADITRLANVDSLNRVTFVLLELQKWVYWNFRSRDAEP